ncbi:50S ribosomal protein L24 [Desulfogranum japonicum]|uniref:50S ribosomal protein L24 n=1 Tax=Desulfogranum japonicum TaxID=231447 RepID=UPI00041D327B|nr:50S ribosomal protein L24 [Desulfogranum japonicum]
MRQGNTSLRVDDQVEIIAGKDKGRVGKILKVDRSNNKVVVERINMIKKHQKPMDATQPGQIIEREAPIHVSNVMLVCPECTETVRIGKKFLEDGNKVRICKGCGATLETSKK